MLELGRTELGRLVAEVSLDGWTATADGVIILRARNTVEEVSHE